MPRCFYRLSYTADAEERLEDAALSKALHDVLGDDLEILPSAGKFPPHGLHLGRGRLYSSNGRQMMASIIPYWDDPAFRAHTTRRWGLFDLRQAGREVERLHATGRDAFVKSTVQAKHFVTRVPAGTSLTAALDAMVYSFIDQPPCLLVQEAVDMRFERRFLVMNGEIITQSPIARHLTPLSRIWEPSQEQSFEDLHFETPVSTDPVHDPALTHRMNTTALTIAGASAHENFCMDLCLLGEDRANGAIEAIEWNPMQPGMIGLFGCDPRRIAQGVATWLASHPDFHPEPEQDLVEMAGEEDTHWEERAPEV